MENAIKKSMAMFISLMMCVTLFSSVPLSAFAAGIVKDADNITFVSDYTDVEIKSKYESKSAFDTTYNKDNNLLSKSKMEFYNCTDGTTWNFINFTRPENLYDGSSLTDDARADGTGSKKYRATIDLGKKFYEISRIYVARSSAFTFGAYEIYVSSDKSTLYNAENKVYSLSNPNASSDKCRADSVTFNGDKPAGKYVGIYTPNSSNYFIFYEFGIEGAELDCFEPDTEKSDFVNLTSITKCCIKGQPYQFSLSTHSGANITSVKYDGATLTDNEGVYTISNTNTNKKFVITTDKDEYSPISGVWRDIDLRNKKDNAELQLKNPDVSIHETALFYDTTIGEKKINRRELSLLYPVDHVVSVRSYDLKTIYYEGEDFIVTADGKIKLTDNTSIPVYGDDPTETLDFRCLKGIKGAYETDWNASTSWCKVKWKYELDITYTHSKTWNKNALYEKPVEDQSENLSYFYNKVKNGEHTNVVFIGSSIMEGYYATAFDTEAYLFHDHNYKLGPTDEKVRHNSLAMFQSAGYTLDDIKEWGGDSFAKQVENAIAHAFGDNFTFINRGVGSSTLQWTLNNKEFLLGPADPNCNPEGCPTPDLVIIYLGGNDADYGYDVYKPGLTQLVNYIRTLNPKCDVIFSTSSVRNRYDANGNMRTYDNGLGGQERAAKELSQELDGMVSVPVWSVSRSMIEDGAGGANYGGTKQIFDLMGDMINHPGDFGHTVWAKCILEAMGLDKIIVCKHTETKVVNQKAATCTTDGYTGDKVCTNCGRTVLNGKTVKKLGHKTTIKTTKATYFADGKKVTKCTVCGKTLKSETIKKLTLKTPTVKVTAKKKALSIKVGKVTGQTGFQIKYRLKGKKWVTKTYTTKKTATKTIKKLKAKKSYQVQVRAMVKSGSKKAYSSWSKTKTVKTKK